MAHKLDQQNQDWKDQVDAGLVPSVTEYEIKHVVDKFWHRTYEDGPVRCNTKNRSGLQTGSSLKMTGKLMKQKKRYVCVVTTDQCVPPEAAAARNGTRFDPPVTINLAMSDPRRVVVSRSSVPLVTTTG
jgi:hypothetical protein